MGIGAGIGGIGRVARVRAVELEKGGARIVRPKDMAGRKKVK